MSRTIGIEMRAIARGDANPFFARNIMMSTHRVSPAEIAHRKFEIFTALGNACEYLRDNLTHEED